MYGLNSPESSREGWKGSSPTIRKWNNFGPKGPRMNAGYEERDRNNDWNFRDDRERYRKRDWEGYSRDRNGLYDPPRSPKRARKMEMDRETPIYHPKKRDFYYPRSPSPSEKDRFNQYYYPRETEFSRGGGGGFYHYQTGSKSNDRGWDPRYRQHFHGDNGYRMREFDRSDYRMGYPRPTRDYERYEDWEKRDGGSGGGGGGSYPLAPSGEAGREGSSYHHMGRYRDSHEGREGYPPREREFEQREFERDFERDPRDFERERQGRPEGDRDREMFEKDREYEREYGERDRSEPPPFGNGERETDTMGEKDGSYYGRDDPYYRGGPDSRSKEDDLPDNKKEDFRRGGGDDSQFRSRSPEEGMVENDHEEGETPSQQAPSSSQKESQSTPTPGTPSATPASKKRIVFGVGLVAFESKTKPSESADGSEEKKGTPEIAEPPVNPSEMPPISSPSAINPVLSPTQTPLSNPSPPLAVINQGVIPPTIEITPSIPTTSNIIPSIQPQPPIVSRTEQQQQQQPELPRDPRLRMVSSQPTPQQPLVAQQTTGLSSSQPIPLESTASSENLVSPTGSNEQLASPPPPTPKQAPPSKPLMSKEEVLHKIEKLEMELSKVDTQIFNLKRPKKADQKHKYRSLTEQILEENKETLKSTTETLNALLPESLLNATEPLYKEPSDLAIYHENINLHEKNKSAIAKVIFERKTKVKDLTKKLTETYERHHDTWTKKVAKLELKRARQKKKLKASAGDKGGPSKEETVPNVATHRRNPLLRSARGGARTRTEFVRTDEEFDQVVSKLNGEEIAEDNKYLNSLAIIPNMILDPHELRFVDNNGLVLDPWAIEKEKKLLHLWTEDEKRVFLDKFLIYHKNFSRIAEFLPNKTTENVILYYYANKRTLDLKKMREQMSKRKVHRKASGNIASTPMPRELASLGVSLPVVDNRPPIVSPPSRRRAEPEDRRRPTLLGPSTPTKVEPGLPSPTVVANPAVNPSAPGSTPAVNSPSTDGDNRWNDTEKELFKEALEKYGEDFKSIAYFLGTKNPFQVKNFYHNYKKQKAAETPSSKGPNIKPIPLKEEQDSEDMEVEKEIDIMEGSSSPDFTEQEKQDMVKYYEIHGPMWKRISSLMGGSKTWVQLKKYFKANKKLFESAKSTLQNETVDNQGTTTNKKRTRKGDKPSTSSDKPRPSTNEKTLATPSEKAPGEKQKKKRAKVAVPTPGKGKEETVPSTTPIESQKSPTPVPMGSPKSSSQAETFDTLMLLANISEQSLPPKSPSLTNTSPSPVKKESTPTTPPSQPTKTAEKSTSKSVQGVPVKSQSSTTVKQLAPSPKPNQPKTLPTLQFQMGRKDNSNQKRGSETSPQQNSDNPSEEPPKQRSKIEINQLLSSTQDSSPPFPPGSVIRTHHSMSGDMKNLSSSNEKPSSPQPVFDNSNQTSSPSSNFESTRTLPTSPPSVSEQPQQPNISSASPPPSQDQSQPEDNSMAPIEQAPEKVDHETVEKDSTPQQFVESTDYPLVQTPPETNQPPYYEVTNPDGGFAISLQPIQTEREVPSYSPAQTAGQQETTQNLPSEESQETVSQEERNPNESLSNPEQQLESNLPPSVEPSENQMEVVPSQQETTTTTDQTEQTIETSNDYQQVEQQVVSSEEQMVVEQQEQEEHQEQQLLLPQDTNIPNETTPMEVEETFQQEEKSQVIQEEFKQEEKPQRIQESQDLPLNDSSHLSSEELRPQLPPTENVHIPTEQTSHSPNPPPPPTIQEITSNPPIYDPEEPTDMPELGRTSFSQFHSISQPIISQEGSSHTTGTPSLPNDAVDCK